MNEPTIEQAWSPASKIIRAEQFEAWSDARQLLSQAHAMIETAQADARKDGYENGQAEGRQAILRVLIDTQARASNYLEHMDREVSALVIALVEQIIGKTPQEESTVLAAKTALSKMRKHKQVRVQVAPSEVLRFQRELAEIPSPTGQSNWFTVEPDTHLQPADCVIATELGYVRADVETQLTNLRETVAAALQARQEET